MRAKTATGVAREDSRKSRKESEVASISGSSLGSVSSVKSAKTSSRTQSRSQRSTKSALVRSLKSRASSAAPSTMSQRQVAIIYIVITFEIIFDEVTRVKWTEPNGLARTSTAIQNTRRFVLTGLGRKIGGTIFRSAF